MSNVKEVKGVGWDVSAIGNGLFFSMLGLQLSLMYLHTFGAYKA